MLECNNNFDPFVANASAALYGVENQNAVEENFHELYLKLVSILETQNSSPSFMPSSHVGKLPWPSGFP